MSIAKLVFSNFHNVPGKLKIGEWFFEVPLDHAKPNSGTIRLFARSVEKVETPAVPEKDKEKKHLPWFLYLQGGPGMSCRNPSAYAWIHPVLEKGFQMLFLDQRGTGLSTTVTAATLAKRGNPQEQADYLRHFRADSIVKDCEAIRKCVTADYPEEKRKWSILGQSFGGFCAVNYLSKFPEGLREVFLSGGLPPLVDGPDPVYEQTYRKLAQRNDVYFGKFPEDLARASRLCERLADKDVRLPNGGFLSPRRFLQLGMFFGFHGGLDMVHDLLLRMTSDLQQFDEFTRPTLTALQEVMPFDDAVLYALLHEPIYCQETKSDWSADRLMVTEIGDKYPVFFTGEMIYKWMFEEYPELQPLQEVAEILAAMDDWPPLYDEAQLAKNDVPVYSACYTEDMYVAFSFAEQTAAKIKGCKQYITNNMYHDAMRGKSEELMKQLFALRDDTID